MLYDILQYLHVLDYDSGKLISGVYRGEFEIAGGVIELPGLLQGQHFVISGSVMNDGVHVYPADALTDETFSGTIHALRLPQAFMDAVESIQTEAEKNAASGGFTSESFGGYSYTRATDSKGRALDVIRANAGRLEPWRML